MCAVSVVTDYWTKGQPNIMWTYSGIPPSREEFEKLKLEVAELKELLKAAKKFDDATGQPDCEKPELADLIQKFGEIFNIDFSEIFSSKKD